MLLLPFSPAAAVSLLLSALGLGKHGQVVPQLPRLAHGWVVRASHRLRALPCFVDAPQGLGLPGCWGRSGGSICSSRPSSEPQGQVLSCLAAGVTLLCPCWGKVGRGSPSLSWLRWVQAVCTHLRHRLWDPVHPGSHYMGPGAGFPVYNVDFVCCGSHDWLGGHLSKLCCVERGRRDVGTSASCPLCAASHCCTGVSHQPPGPQEGGLAVHARPGQTFAGPPALPATCQL